MAGRASASRRPGRLQLRVAGFGFLVVAVAVGVYALLGKVTARRRDARAPVRASRQPGGLLERPRPDDGDGRSPSRWRSPATARRTPPGGCWPPPPRVPLSFDLLLHALSRRLGRAGGRAGRSTSPSRRRGSPVSRAWWPSRAPAAAVLWRLRGLDTLFTRDHGRRAAHRPGPRAAALGAGGAASSPRRRRLVVGARAPRRAVAALGAAGRRRGRAGRAGRRRRAVAPGGSSSARGGIDLGRRSASQTFIGGRRRDRSPARAPTRLISLNTGRPPLWREALAAVPLRRRAAAPAPAPSSSRTSASARTAASSSTRTASGSTCSASSASSGSVLFAAAIALFCAAAVRNPFADRGDPLRPLLVALQAGHGRLRRPHLLGLGLGHGGDRHRLLPVRRRLLVVPGTRAATGGTATLGARRAGRAARWRRPSRDDARRGDAARRPGRRRGGAAGPVAAGARRDAGRCAPLASAALVLLAVELARSRTSRRARRAPRSPRPATATPPTRSTSARRAARLDPLAVDPLITESLVLQQLGRNRRGAGGAARRPQRLQPDNYEVYYQRGRAAAAGVRRRKARHRGAAARSGAESARRAQPLRARAGRPALTPRAGGGSRPAAAPDPCGRLPPVRSRSRRHTEVLPTMDPAAPDRRRRHGLRRARLGGVLRPSRPPRGVHGHRRGKIARLDGATCPSTSPASTSSSTTTRRACRSRPPTTSCSRPAAILFIAVDTPPSPSGDADLSRVQHATSRDRARAAASGCSS